MHVLGQVLGHALGQRGDEDAIALRHHLARLVDEVVHLGRSRADQHRWVDQAGGTDHLLGEHAAGLLELPGGRGRRHIDRLRPHGVPFLEAQRPVVHAGGEAEAIFGKGGLALVVAAEHAADLRDGDMALVDEDECVVGQIFEQGRRRLAGFAPGEIARVVLDAGARAGGLDHLEVEQGALLEPLGL